MKYSHISRRNIIKTLAKLKDMSSFFSLYLFFFLTEFLHSLHFFSLYLWLTKTILSKLFAIKQGEHVGGLHPTLRPISNSVSTFFSPIILQNIQTNLPSFTCLLCSSVSQLSDTLPHVFIFISFISSICFLMVFQCCVSACVG